jgi:hypothetical protein
MTAKQNYYQQGWNCFHECKKDNPPYDKIAKTSSGDKSKKWLQGYEEAKDIYLAGFRGNFFRAFEEFKRKWNVDISLGCIYEYKGEYGENGKIIMTINGETYDIS